MIVVTNGEVTTAGSSFIFVNKNGSYEPTNLAKTTATNKVNDTIPESDNQT